MTCFAPEGAKEEEVRPLVKSDDTFQAFSVIAVTLIAMGEDVGAKMSLRQFDALCISNPQLPILDTLPKYNHDNGLAVAFNAIFAMVSSLAGYSHKEPGCLFMIRIAQGLIHMGKGLIELDPFFADRSIMSQPVVADLSAMLMAFTDAKHFVLDKYHWMMYFLVTAMYPRFLITVDEQLNSMPVTMRVGQALDVVGQAGKPQTISGFQTHQTPVQLATTRRAELVAEEFIPFGHVLEGFVILQTNPGWEKEDKM
ncbi:26S proteasome regulatory subunit RPN1 [Mycena venus]|uniref:26S proteasome regulatory subunit RPN1 n=1 Tax=Mycena venus TaxID=2733690 RepID=A0A8H7CZ14_9AGAR|nr:26S proteasome regulatory subunit RPN1 [Mycena venus]